MDARGDRWIASCAFVATCLQSAWARRALSSYTAEDAGKAALLAGIAKSPRDYAPVADEPGPLRRRNEILALMARNGYIPDDLTTRAQAEPVSVVAADPVKTHASAAIGSVLDELERRGGDRFGVGELFLGRVSVRTTVDERVQTIVNAALENGLALYEQRHPKAKGRIQGSVVVLRNGDAAILAEAGGREVYQERHNAYSDFNRATESMRQPGSAWKRRSGSPTTTTASRARWRPARPWPSPATPCPCGSCARSAWTTWSGPPGTWESARRSSAT